MKLQEVIEEKFTEKNFPKKGDVVRVYKAAYGNTKKLIGDGTIKSVTDVRYNKAVPSKMPYSPLRGKVSLVVNIDGKDVQANADYCTKIE
ncbi:MAG: hypothetical protein AABY22_05290 [Nanoarchaeota archaeon]